MPTYYVGPGGNNANAGTSWALRKLTLNGSEDIPVQAGDTVYVGAGTYRETLTCDVSGSAGSPITYIGDYSGANTDGVGGVVRITGSDNDQTETRSDGIVTNSSGPSEDYRTFRNFVIDTTSARCIYGVTANNWTVENCYLVPGTGYGILISGNVTGLTVRNCFVSGYNASVGYAVGIQHSSTVDNAGHLIENLIAWPYNGVVIDRVGGVTVRNSVFVGGTYGVRVSTALSAGQTITVNNCILAWLSTYAFRAVNLGEITENYNALYRNGADRLNVGVGANSNAYPPLFDARWFFEAVNGGDMVTPFDLASYSQLVNVAGTSPTTTDLRGTSVVGAQREWGALEYDPALLIEAGSGGGGAVSISPFRGNF